MSQVSDELVANYQYYHKYAAFLCKDYNEGRELLHDTWFKLHAINTLVANNKWYVKSTIKNTFISAIRKRWRQNQKVKSLNDTDQEEVAKDYCYTQTPEQNTVGKQFYFKVMACLDDLTKSEKKTVLAIFNEDNMAEYARRIGKNTETVRLTNRRGILKLRERLKEYETK